MTNASTVTTFDDRWYRSVTEFAQDTGWLHGIMSLLTVALIAALAVMVLAAGWSAWRRSDRERLAGVAWTVVGTGICVLCGLLLKQVFREARPCLTLPGVTTVQPCPGPTDYSFPSDHMTVAVALAAGLWLIDRRLGVIGAVLALLEGFSRVYLGQHYPHDVFAAIILSTLIIVGLWPLAHRILARVLRLRTAAGRGAGDAVRPTR
jgi:membrane-associated phospholipid phosphatase